MTSVSRVARDSRGQRTLFEEIVVGDDLGSIEWQFTTDDIARLCESDSDYHEWYSVDSPYGGVVAPILISYPPVRALFCKKYNIRGLFYQLEVESYAPLRPNTRYKLYGKVIDKWVKRDREFVKYDAIAVDPQGNKVFYTTRTHVLDYLPRTVPKTAEGVDSGGGGWAGNDGPGRR